MDQKLAVLFMPDDMTLTKEQAPLMLRPILFCPILTWMVEELMGRGIERFFIVSDKRAHDMMRPYVPENADVVYVDGARHGEELLTLLKDEKGSVLIVNGAVLPVGVFSGGAVYSADAKECCKVLKEHGAFAAFPKGAEITKGFLPVGDDEELRSAQDMCRRKIADKHFAAGVDRVLTMDLHANQIQGFFDIPVDNLFGNPIFVDYYAKKFGSVCEDLVVVSPDVGSVARARTFAQKLHMNLAIVDKRRQKANQCEVMNVIGDVEGKECILYDDMVDTAGSLCNAAKAVVEVGGAKKVYACASHGVLSGPALERLEASCIEELALLDTIPAPVGEAELAKARIKYLTVAHMFAEAIERTYQEISIAKLFN